MSNAAQIYQRNANASSTPRETESQILIETAARFQRIHDNWYAEASALNLTLLMNRKIWSVFLSSVMMDECPHPREIRENIANLAVFIFARTLELQIEPKREMLTALININRQIAAGLNGRG